MSDESVVTDAGKSVLDEGTPEEVMPDGVTKDKLSGVFSTQTVEKVGTGTTTRKTILKTYWYAQEGEPDEDGGRMIYVQPLNANNIPSGTKTPHPIEEFLAKFNSEIEFYQEQVFPKLKELDNTLKRAEEKRDQGALYSAQFEFEAALDFDENNVRANFGLGLTYMARGDNNKAGDIFKRVVGLDAAFSPEHKHLFNEFGINLRKSNLHEQAVEYYVRALEMTKDDENLHYNIARAYFEKGDKEECIKHLRKAVEIKPDFDEAKKFLEFINKT